MCHRSKLSHIPPSGQGFTLIELSIVLVIIGLIVGGVLTGQDLIKAAETRATIGQIEKYNTAINTFRTKYNSIPGDVPNDDNFGLETRTNTTGRGDGNGLIEGGASGATVAVGETVLFWRDLSDTALIDGSFNGTNTDTAIAAGTVGETLPPAKLGRGNYITVYAASGVNYYQIAGVVSTSAAGAYTLTNSLSPSESYNMDTKIDDGRPLSGTVQAMESTTTLNSAAAAGAATCVFTGGTAYNMTTTTLGNTPLCQLRFRFN